MSSDIVIYTAPEKEPNALRVIAVGFQGIILTDGVKLYHVWKSGKQDAPGYEWTGVETREVTSAFHLVDPSMICGAEVDMRNDDEDSMTPEMMDLGDSVAAALNDFFNAQEKSGSAEWSRIQKGGK